MLKDNPDSLPGLAPIEACLVGGFAINKYGFEEYEECDLEYPDEDVYLDADGEVDYDEYDVAMEEFYEEVYETKDLCQQNCLDVLNELKEEATS